MIHVNFTSQKVYRVVAVLLLVVSLGFCAPRAEKAVFKSRYDTREYSTYQLDNGISAISVRHAKSPKSGYAAAVGAGSLYDPVETQGLAHLLEHMLFLGTKSHPGTSSYDDFLSRHGGLLNAWTSEERTVFHNQIDNDAFPEALQRFSEFFTEPLLNGTSRQREILAVDAEHEKNVPSDSRRMWAVLTSHFPFPINHFNTGNNNTLARLPASLGVDISDYLRKFHLRHYCGSNLVVVTLSPLAIDMQKRLVQQLFGKVNRTNNGMCRSWKHDPARFPLPNMTLVNSHETLQYFFPPIYFSPMQLSNKPSSLSQIASHPLSRLQKPESNRLNLDEYGEYVINGWNSLQSVGPLYTQMKANGQHTVWMAWPLPPSEYLYKEKPVFYLRYMIGYSGRHSLTRDLIHRQWISALEVDEYTSSIGSYLIIEFSPTSLGKNHIWDIVERLSGFVNDLRSFGVDQEVLNSLLDQTSMLFSILEASKDTGDTVAEMADSLMHVSDPAEVLSSRNLVSVANASRITEFLDYLSPLRCILINADPDWQAPSGTRAVLPDGKTILESDPFYQLNRTTTPLDPAIIERLLLASAGARKLRASPNSDDPNTINAPPSYELPTTDLFDTSVIALPPPVEKLPQSFTVFNRSSVRGIPEIIMLTPSIEIWWRGGGEFPTPKARFELKLRYSAGETKLKSFLASRLYCYVVSDIVSTKLADFQNAGYSASIYSSGTAFIVHISGFNDRKTLLELILLMAITMKQAMQSTTESRYQRLREDLLSQLEDTSSSRPTRLSLAAARATLLNNAFLREDSYEELRYGSIFQNYSTVAERTRTKLRNVHTTAYSMGLSKRDTLEFVRAFLKEADLKLLTKRKAADSLSIDLTSPLEIYLKNPITDDTSNAAVMIFRSQFPTSIEEWVETQILGNMLGTKIMEHLRTIKQLGYIAGASVTSVSSLLRIATYVEGPRESATKEMEALQEVVEEIGRNITRMSDTELHQWRFSLKGDLDTTLINSDDEHTRLWSEIEQGLYCFQRAHLQSRYLLNDSVWNNSASRILSNAFRRLTRPERQLKIYMSSLINSMNSSSTTPDEISSELLKENTTQIFTLNTENIKEFQKHFGFLPLSTVCHLKYEKSF